MQRVEERNWLHQGAGTCVTSARTDYSAFSAFKDSSRRRGTSEASEIEVSP